MRHQIGEEIALLHDGAADCGPVARLLHLSPLHADDWLLAGAAGLASGALASLIMWRRRTHEPWMIVLPLLGWVMLSAEGKAIPFFGLQLPALLGANEALAERTKEVHETLATLGYFLIGLHALAALFHHYVRRDNTLRRMRLSH